MTWGARRRDLVSLWLKRGRQSEHQGSQGRCRERPGRAQRRGSLGDAASLGSWGKVRRGE